MADPALTIGAAELLAAAIIAALLAYIAILRARVARLRRALIEADPLARERRAEARARAKVWRLIRQSDRAYRRAT